MEQQMQDVSTQIQQEEIEIDLKEILKYLLKNLWRIVVTGLLAVILGGVCTYLLITPLYESTSKLYVSGNTEASTIASLTSLQLGSQLTTDYAELLTTIPVLEEVIDECELDMDAKELESAISVGTLSSSRVMTITVTNEDPELAKKITDTLANVAVEEISTVLETNKPVIVEDGMIEEAPVNRNIVKNSAMAGVCGVAVCIFILVIAYILDDRIKSEEEIRRYLQLTSLGSIPNQE